MLFLFLFDFLPTFLPFLVLLTFGLSCFFFGTSCAWVEAVQVGVELGVCGLESCVVEGEFGEAVVGACISGLVAGVLKVESGVTGVSIGYGVLSSDSGIECVVSRVESGIAGVEPDATGEELVIGRVEFELK